MDECGSRAWWPSSASPPSTEASWLKQRGVDSKVVADLLGHTSTRMVDLVYGQLNDAVLIAATSLLPDVPSAETGNAWVTERGRQGRRMGPVRQSPTAKITANLVPRDGIEPPTRGFSIPCSTN